MRRIGILLGLLLIGVTDVSASDTSVCTPLVNPFGQSVGVECTWSAAATVHQCPARMEAAMRAREEWATLTDESRRWVTTGSSVLAIADGTSYTVPYSFNENDVLVYTPDTRTEEERLADEYKALDERRRALTDRRIREVKEKEERARKDARIAVLKQQWEDGKACWSNP